MHDEETVPDKDAPDGLARLGPLLQRKPLTARRATVIISGYTLLVTLAGGTLEWLVDRNEFPTLGAGLWWALQTVTTVGYGDVVPRNTGGRLVGVVVILSGIGFLTVITATVTASLIEAARHRVQVGLEPEVAKQLEAIAGRLSAIERRVGERDGESQADR